MHNLGLKKRTLSCIQMKLYGANINDCLCSFTVKRQILVDRYQFHSDLKNPHYHQCLKPTEDQLSFMPHECITWLIIEIRARMTTFQGSISIEVGEVTNILTLANTISKPSMLIYWVLCLWYATSILGNMKHIMHLHSFFIFKTGKRLDGSKLL